MNTRPNPTIALAAGFAFALLLGLARPAQPGLDGDAILARLAAIDRGLFAQDSRLKSSPDESIEGLLRGHGAELRALRDSIESTNIRTSLRAIESRLGRPGQPSVPDLGDALVRIDRRVEALAQDLDRHAGPLDELADAVRRLEQAATQHPSRLERRLDEIERRLRAIEDRLR